MQNFIQFLRASESANGKSGATLEGKPITFADLAERGYYTPQPRNDAAYQANFREAMRLYNRVLGGDRQAAFRFQEAMTMSDFPVYFGDILDRSILSNYAETPYSWNGYIKRAMLRDFRQSRIMRADRGASVLDGPIVPNSYGASGSGSKGIEEITEYPLRKREITGYTDQLYRFGARMDYSWETMINDDLDALRDTPALFGRAARRTEEKRATSLFVSSTGPNGTFFSTANGNLITNSAAQYAFVTTNNPVLSITSLSWALIILSMQKDLDGEPIAIDGAVLVVPPALEITARNIVNAIQIFMNDQGGTQESFGTDGIASAQRLLTENWARGRVTPLTNYYLPIVNTTTPNTAWYVFASPSAGRPAAQLSFLSAHESPEIFMKASNAVPIGGGAQTGAMEGDFDSDAIQYKIRHVLGGTLLDPKMAVASTGAGS